MRNVPVIFKRELMAYFLSPLAYIITVLFLVVTGITFSVVLETMSGAPQGVGVIGIFFFWLYFVLILALPMITMRLFAEEKSSGTLEVLMTAPVTDTEVVLGKYFALLVFYVCMWAPTFMYVFILRWFSRETAPIDLGLIWSGYLGILLVGMLLLAIGFLCSALTKSQVVAAILCFVVGILFFFLLPLFAGGYFSNREMIAYFSPVHHIISEFSVGWIDVRRIVFYLTTTAWVLYLTEKIIEARKWK